MNEIFDFNFFFGGDARFTVKSGKSGKHWTFRIRKAKDSDVYFANLLTGSDNEKSYTYIGLTSRDKFLRLTTNSRFKEQSIPVIVFRWALDKVKNRKSIPAGYQIIHEGRCCRCGRTLTDPESIRLGIGSECIKKVKDYTGQYFQQLSIV
jgi:hypothetical protein